MVSPRRGFDGSINTWQWTIGGNGRFCLDEVMWQRVVGHGRHRTQALDGLSRHVYGSDGHLSGLMVTSS